MGHGDQRLNHFDEAGGNDEEKEENHDAQEVAVFIRTGVDQPILNQDVDKEQRDEEVREHAGGERFPNPVRSGQFSALRFVATHQNIRDSDVDEVVDEADDGDHEDNHGKKEAPFLNVLYPSPRNSTTSGMRPATHRVSTPKR